jgi:hypothetical protein
MNNKKNHIENRMRKHFDFVVFLICIILVCILSNGCKSKQLIVGTNTQSHTNTTTTTILKDTIIEVRFVAEPPIYIYVPAGDTTPSDTAILENRAAKAMAFLLDGKLHLSLSAKDTTIPVHIPNAIRETTTNQTTTEKETTVVQQQENRKYFGSTLIERILILIGLIFLIVLGISITHKRGLK